MLLQIESQLKTALHFFEVLIILNVLGVLEELGNYLTVRVFFLLVSFRPVGQVLH